MSAQTMCCKGFPHSNNLNSPILPPDRLPTATQGLSHRLVNNFDSIVDLCENSVATPNIHFWHSNLSKDVLKQGDTLHSDIIQTISMAMGLMWTKIFFCHMRTHRSSFISWVRISFILLLALIYMVWSQLTLA